MVSMTVTGFEVPVNGATLCGEQAGSGSSVVLLHAGICDRRMFDAAFAALAESFRVVRFDQRGIGESVRDSSAGNVPFRYHEDLLAVLDALGIRRASLVGCSFGGRVALDLALTAPGRVDRLVLVGSRPGGAEPVEDPEADRLAAQIDAAFAAGDFARANALEAGLFVNGPRRDPGRVDPAIRDFVVAMNLPSFTSGWYGEGSVPLDPPAAGRLTEVRAPTLIVVGDHDARGELVSAEEMGKQIPNARVVHFADCSHLPSLEQPDRFIGLLRESLRPEDD